jgi:ribose/xylose/arabinose/galactoside ABC-type transport system permease subunit
MTAMPDARGAAGKQSHDWALMWEKYGIAAVLVISWILAALFVPNFASAANLQNVLRTSSFVGVAAVGMTIAIIAGTFDLSVGSTLALAAVATVWIGARFGVVPSIIAGLLVGITVGAVNGFLVARVRIPAFIATLGMLFVVAGFTLVVAGGGRAFQYNAPKFVWLGNGDLLGIPVPFIIFLICALVGEGILRRTAFGRHVFAVGSNTPAARIAGVPVESVIWRVFIVVGFFTGIAAVLVAARLYSASPGLEPGFELRVIATVVLGGTRLQGGRGGMLGTVAAALLFATLGNVLNLLHADAFWQRVVEGLVLLVALSIEGIRQRVEERMSRQMHEVTEGG